MYFCLVSSICDLYCSSVKLKEMYFREKRFANQEKLRRVNKNQEKTHGIKNVYRHD